LVYLINVQLTIIRNTRWILSVEYYLHAGMKKRGDTFVRGLASTIP